MRLSVPVSAFVAAVVGFGGTLALVIAAAAAVGATRAETASWITSKGSHSTRRRSLSLSAKPVRSRRR